jgi:hypothetical protein
VVRVVAVDNVWLISYAVSVSVRAVVTAPEVSFETVIPTVLVAGD